MRLAARKGESMAGDEMRLSQGVDGGDGRRLVRKLDLAGKSGTAAGTGAGTPVDLCLAAEVHGRGGE